MGWFADRLRIVEPIRPLQDTLTRHAQAAAQVAEQTQRVAEYFAAPQSIAIEDARQRAVGAAQTASALAGDVADVGVSDAIDLDKLGDVFRWSAAGFAVLSSLLLFFGLKEGTLDQALRLNSQASLCVFILLGIGVVAALFGPTLKPKLTVRVYALICAVGLMVAMSSLYLPNFVQVDKAQLAASMTGTSDPSFLTTFRVLVWVLPIVALVLGVVAFNNVGFRRILSGSLAGATALAELFIVGRLYAHWQTHSTTSESSPSVNNFALMGLLIASFAALIIITFSNGAKLPATAALVIIAVAATSIGLYGGTKLAVQSKQLAVVPEVSATVEGTGTDQHLQIIAKAGHSRGMALKLAAAGTMRQPSLLLDQRNVVGTGAETSLLRDVWNTTAFPNALDEIDQTFTVPFTVTRWETVEITYCQIAVTSSESCVSATEVTTIHNSAPASGVEQISGDIRPGSAKNTVDVRVGGSDVAPGTLVSVELSRLTKKRQMRHLADATLAPSDAAQISWETTIKDGVSGEGLVLRARVCPPGKKCPAVWGKLASYHF